MNVAHSFSPDLPTVVEPFELAGDVLRRVFREMAQTASPENREALTRLAEQTERK